MRDAMYHTLTGEPISGKKAAEWKLVNEAVPLAKLKDRVVQKSPNVLLKKNPVTLKAAKDAVRRVQEMTFDNAEDYLIRAQEAANFFDNEGRKEGMRQFLDDKTLQAGHRHVRHQQEALSDFRIGERGGGLVEPRRLFHAHPFCFLARHSQR